MQPVSPEQIREIVTRALEEDAPFGDVTTTALFPQPVSASAVILANQRLTVAGLAVAIHTFQQVGASVTVTEHLSDGSMAQAGAAILTVAGDARSILRAERVALNFLQHLSGVATLTRAYCDAIRGYPAKILDTRKTTPGLRALEKWAVDLGGGTNHRFSLSDGLMIKDNHIALLAQAGLSLADGCRRARERAPHQLRMIVEVDRLEQIPMALDGGADVILLDNMVPTDVRKAVDLIKGRALVEVSGGVGLATVRDYAAAGADFISIGALTHSAPAVDISLDLSPV
ncbi:MAG: carboxylating nicotinate-nucleotide diphosphorylase [Nitrospiraceae bacterium]